MNTINIEDLLIFHSRIIDETGGNHGIKDLNLIENALNRAYITFNRKYFHDEILDKITVITSSLINNRGFWDGNKRIGLSTMLLLLKLNNFEIEFSQEELVALGNSISSGLVNEIQIRSWIEKHLTGKIIGIYE